MTRTISTAILMAALSISLPKRSDGQLYSFTIATVAGNYPFGDGGPATDALLRYPFHMTFDAHGNAYFADPSDQKVRKVAGGTITTIAGTGLSGFSGDGGPAINAQLKDPCGVAVDSAGNVYIYDAGNSRIRKVDPQGIITTFSGNGTFGYGGDGGPASQAVLNLALAGGLAMDSAGNLYIADGYNHRIRKVSAKDGAMSTVAGNGIAGNTGDGGPATAATIAIARDIAVDAQGNLYIAAYDSNKIRKVTAGPSNIISVLAGTGTAGFSGDGGPAAAAQLNGPDGVAVDASGTVYIADSFNSRIRMVRGGTISEFAGADHASGDGGKAAVASFYNPERVAWDTQGNYYVADTSNNRIRKVTAADDINTVAGSGSAAASADGGAATSAGIPQPRGVAVDGSGNLFISTQNQIRKVDGHGIISTVANATNTAGFNGDGAAATGALLNTPVGLAVDSTGALYVADALNYRIRKISGGIITTVAGSGPVCSTQCPLGTFTGDGGPATSATLYGPSDLAFDSAGNLLIVDTLNNRIRLVDADGNISTIAGSGSVAGYAGDLGPATSALLSQPAGVGADSAGNVYIADSSNNVIRMVDGYGIISTIAGTNKVGFSGDGGPAASAAMNTPNGIVADQSGSVWFVDVFNSRVRKLTPSGPLVGNGPLGVVNAASFVSGGLVPGGMATLFGSNLTSATGINLAGSLPLAKQLLNSSVKFNNTIDAPIFAVDNVNGQQQINFQVPWELDGLQSVVLQVVNNGALSPTVRVPVLAAQPGVFAYNVGADTFGVVLHANFQLADKAHPVTGDEVVLIYCTNLGKVSPEIADGVAGTGAEMTVVKPVVTIGNAPADVSFSGLAPGFVGLNQINAKVPKGLAAKNQPLVVKVNGASSASVLLPVK